MRPQTGLERIARTSYVNSSGEAWNIASFVMYVGSKFQKIQVTSFFSVPIFDISIPWFLLASRIERWCLYIFLLLLIAHDCTSFDILVPLWATASTWLWEWEASCCTFSSRVRHGSSSSTRFALIYRMLCSCHAFLGYVRVQRNIKQSFWVERARRPLYVTQIFYFHSK